MTTMDVGGGFSLATDTDYTGGSEHTGATRRPAAPFVVSSAQRESFILHIFLSGGGSWAFYHYGLVRPILLAMIDGKMPHCEIRLVAGTSGSTPLVKAMAHTLNADKPYRERLIDLVTAMDKFYGFFTAPNFLLRHAAKQYMNPATMVEDNQEFTAAMMEFHAEQATLQADDTPVSWMSRFNPLNYFRAQSEHMRRFLNQWALTQAVKGMDLVDPGRYDQLDVLTNAALQRVPGQAMENYFFRNQGVTASVNSVIASCSVIGFFPGVKHPEGMLWDGGYKHNPPMGVAMDAFDLGDPAPSDKVRALVGLVESPDSPTINDDSGLSNKDVDFAHGQQIADEIRGLQDRLGFPNVIVASMFDAVRRPHVSRGTKAVPVPEHIQSFAALGERDSVNVIGSLTLPLRADRRAPA